MARNSKNNHIDKDYSEKDNRFIIYIANFIGNLSLLFITLIASIMIPIFHFTKVYQLSVGILFFYELYIIIYTIFMFLFGFGNLVKGIELFLHTNKKNMIKCTMIHPNVKKDIIYINRLTKESFEYGKGEEKGTYIIDDEAIIDNGDIGELDYIVPFPLPLRYKKIEGSHDEELLKLKKFIGKDYNDLSISEQKEFRHSFDNVVMFSQNANTLTDWKKETFLKMLARADSNKEQSMILMLATMAILALPITIVIILIFG